MAGVKITYETLFDLLRREKSRNDLQELESTFFVDVLTYLKEKQSTLTSSSDSKLFSSAENEKIKIQLKNVKKILDELYEIRQKKILNMAVHKSKTNSNLIDTSKMLVEEHSLFLETYTLLSKFKRNIIGNILQGEIPKVAGVAPGAQRESVTAEKSESTEENSSKAQDSSEAKAEDKEGQDDPDSTQKTESEDVKPAEKPVNSSDSKKVKFLANLPKFLGLDKKVYGPFKVDEVTEVPSDLAEMLIKKGRAQALES